MSDLKLIRDLKEVVDYLDDWKSSDNVPSFVIIFVLCKLSNNVNGSWPETMIPQIANKLIYFT